MALPTALAGGIYGLLPPTQAVTVALAEDELVDAVTVQIDNEDWHTGGSAEIEIWMPDPFVLVRISRRFEPAVGQDEVATAIASDVAIAQAVTLMVVGSA